MYGPPAANPSADKLVPEIPSPLATAPAGPIKVEISMASASSQRSVGKSIVIGLDGQSPVVQAVVPS